MFLGDLGLTGDELLPAAGWLRWAAIVFYAILALLIAAIVILLVASS